MDTLEIEKTLQSIDWFRGVFACNMLPKGIVYNRPAGYVVNTDPSTLPGEHWVAIYLPLHGPGEYFDSFGQPPINREIVNFLDKNSPSGWIYNTVQIQEAVSTSTVCGNYTILFLLSKLTRMSLCDFQLLYKRQPAHNDFIVEELFKP